MSRILVPTSTSRLTKRNPFDLKNESAITAKRVSRRMSSIALADSL